LHSHGLEAALADRGSTGGGSRQWRQFGGDVHGLMAVVVENDVQPPPVFDFHCFAQE
jgi:hypothetical protein